MAQIPKHRESQYNRLRAAVRCYEAGQIADITGKHRISVDQARRTYEACVSINPSTDQVFGFFRCIPGRRFHTRAQTRRAPFDPKHTSNGRGWKLALQHVFDKYPEVLRRLTEFVLTRKLRLTDVNDSNVQPYAKVGPPEAHAAFLSLCEKAGIAKSEWPFCADRQGESAIYDWYRGMRAAYPIETTQNEHGDDAAAKAKVAHNESSENLVKPPRKRAYQEVHLDEHAIDGVYAVMYPGPNNLWVVVEYLRLWLLALVESLNGTILSTVTTFGPSFNTDDLFKLFRRALWPLPPFELTFQTPAHRYRKGACYPGELAELRGLTFQVVKFDRHSTHTTAIQRGALEQVLGVEFKPGVVGHPMQQHMVENTFGVLENMVKGLPNTTGKHPTDPVRRDPEGAARRLKLPPLLAAEVFDVAARNHNASVHTGNLSRIDELLQWRLTNNMYVSRVDDYGPHNGHLLLPAIPVFVTRTNGATGPFGVYHEYARYSSKDLRSCAELEASNDWSGLLYPQEDARNAFFTASAVKNRVFELEVMGSWRDVPHSIAWRSAIGALRNSAKRYESVSNTRATLELTDLLGQKAENGDAAATVLLSQITNQMAEMSLGRYGEVPGAQSDPRAEAQDEPDTQTSTTGQAPSHAEEAEQAEELRRILEKGAAGTSQGRAEEASEGQRAGERQAIRRAPAANEPLSPDESLESSHSNTPTSARSSKPNQGLTDGDDPWGFNT